MGAAAWIVLLDMLGDGGVIPPAPPPVETPQPGAGHGAGRKPREKPTWWQREYVDWPYEQKAEPERRKRIRHYERRLARTKEIDAAIEVARQERAQLAAEFLAEQAAYEALDDLLSIAERDADLSLLRREFAIEMERARMEAMAHHLARQRADDEALMVILMEVL